MLGLGAGGCGPSKKRLEMLEWNERRAAEMATEERVNGKGATFQSCMAEKRPMLDACMPFCDSDPSLMAEAYDACLQACAKRNFGKAIPMCSAP
jgi:hypothetical protein